MPMAFVLINTEIGSESEVLGALKKIDAVKESYMVYGVYDVVAKVRADTMDKLKEIVRVIILTDDSEATTNLIDQLLASPLKVKNFKPLSRVEIYERT